MPNTSVFVFFQLANNIPDAKIMQDIASTVVSFACDAQQQYQLVVNALRVLMSFTDHNHGMLILQKYGFHSSLSLCWSHI